MRKRNKEHELERQRRLETSKKLTTQIIPNKKKEIYSRKIKHKGKEDGTLS